jgi:class 3 adenylate cyclase/tetratricopeptide (TPR) repeat protein
VERRQISVVFVDIVESVSLSRRLDAEEFGSWIARYQAFCTQTVLRYGGHPARFFGDGVLAYFGYPQAHEDDPERAVQAGLEIVAGVPEVASPGNLRLQARVGVATGLVVVGEIVHGSVVSQGQVYGDTPNLAGRLQAIAEANTVLIDDSTRQRVGGLFRLTSLGRCDVKGIEGGTETWRVDGLAAENRFDARRSNAPAQLIGRGPELALLFDRWSVASAGEGQVVLVSGEAGIGKSALLYTFDDRLGDVPRITLTLSCGQFHQETALHPVLVHIRRAASFDLEDGAERKREKLAAIVQQLDGMPPDAVALIAECLSLPPRHDASAPRNAPQRRKEDTLAALVAYFRLHARLRPLLLLIEDAHWIDPTTRELLTELVEEIRNDRVMVVLTSRPGTNLGWLGEAHFSQIVLNRLSRPYATSLITAVAQRELPKDIVQDIIRNSEGVPLYLEELVTAVVRSGVVDLSTAAVVPGGSEIRTAVPSTLQGSLLERLDRMPAVKEIAHVCAVIGRSFPARMLATVLPISEMHLEAGLEQLVQAGLLSRRRESNERSFAFKHTLMQQAVYDSLLISRRREIHARIARAMVMLEEEGFPAEPSVLAYHYAQAQLVEDAVKYLKIAGQQAMRQSAVIEAAALIGRALDLLGTTPRNATRDRIEIDLQITMGQALIAGKGVAFPDVGQAFDRARVLCDELGDTAALFPIMLAKCRSHQLRGELRAAAEIAQDFAKRAEDSQEVTVRAMAHRCLGLVCYHDGRLERASQSFETALRLYDPDHRASVSFQLVNNPKIVCCIHLSGLLFATGRSNESERHIAAAKEELAKHNDPFDAAVILHHWSLLQVFRRDPVAAMDIATRLCLLADEQGFPQLYAMGLVHCGWARAMTGHPSGGCDDIERAIALYRRTGAELNFSLYQALMADALAAGGHQSKAMDCLGTAIHWTEQTMESTCGFAAEIHRLAAGIIANETMAGDSAVLAELDRAIEIARTQGGIAWEARATADLGRYLASANRPEEAESRIHEFTRRANPALNGPDLAAVRQLLPRDASVGPGRKSVIPLRA